jgi:TonB family protein
MAYKRTIALVFFCACLAQTLSAEDSLRLVTFVAPPYPREARDKRIQGPVLARLRIGKDGTVQSVEIVKAYPLFGKYTSAALSKWRFDPISAESTLDVTVDFVFHDDECEGSNLHPQTPETNVSAELPSKVKVSTGLSCIETSTNATKSP